MDRRSAMGLLVAMGWSGSAQAQEALETTLDADEIVAAARRWVLQTRGHFRGVMRQKDTRLPFQVEFFKREVHYRFPSLRREIVIAPTTHEVWNARLEERLGNTDITVEDLSLWYLAWLDAEIVATRSKKWIVSVFNPTALGNFGSAELQVHMKSGAMAAAEVFDRGGQKIRSLDIKRVEILEPGQTYIPTRIRVKVHDATGEKESAWIEITEALQPT